MKLVVEKIRGGDLGITENNPELNEYIRSVDDLSEKDGILLYKGRIVVPKVLRQNVLDVLHATGFIIEHKS